MLVGFTDVDEDGTLIEKALCILGGDGLERHDFGSLWGHSISCSDLRLETY
jgi:hypothetical protein